MACRRRVWATALALMASACTQATTVDSAEMACENVSYALTWQAAGRPFFRTYCTSCHSVDAEQRFNAPVGVDFDTKEDVVFWEERVRARALEEATMPLGGGVPDDALTLLGDYLTCGL